MEKELIIQNQAIRLQAMLAEKAADKGVVITHPHPLYGGIWITRW